MYFGAEFSAAGSRKVPQASNFHVEQTTLQSHGRRIGASKQNPDFLVLRHSDPGLNLASRLARTSAKWVMPLVARELRRCETGVLRSEKR